MSAKSNKIPAFAPLLDAIEQVLGSLKDLIFVADALHTQVNHATDFHRASGDTNIARATRRANRRP